MDTYWTYSIDNDEMRDEEFESRDEALLHAELEFSERCEDCEAYAGYDCNVDLIEFRYDNDGEVEVVQKEQRVLEYEPWRGDYTEHSVWHKGGVL